MRCSLAIERRYLISHGPRQQFVNAVDGVLGDHLQHVTQVGLGVHPVEFSRADKGVDCGGALTSRTVTGINIRGCFVSMLLTA